MLHRIGTRMQRGAHMGAGPFWRASEHLLDGVVPGFFADFSNSRFALNGQLVNPSDIFSVTSAAGSLVFASGGVFRAAGANELRQDNSNGVGELLAEGDAPAMLLQSANLMSGFWSPVSSISRSALSGTTLGLFNRVQLITSGISSERYDQFPSVTSGVPISFQVFAEAGTSGNIMLNFRDASLAVESRLRGTLGAATVSASFAGSLTNILQTQIIPGVWWIRGTFTPNFTGTLTFGVGPFSSVAGETVIINYANLYRTPQPTSPIITTGALVTRTADLVTLTPAAASILLGAGGAVAARAVYPVRSNSVLVGYNTNRMVGPTAAANSVINNNGVSDLTAVAGSGGWDTSSGACFTWGAAGRRIAMNGGADNSDAGGRGTGSGISIGPSTGMPAGQTIRLRQLVGWSLPDRATAAAVQAQARAA